MTVEKLPRPSPKRTLNDQNTQKIKFGENFRLFIGPQLQFSVQPENDDRKISRTHTRASWCDKVVKIPRKLSSERISGNLKFSIEFEKMIKKILQSLHWGAKK